MNRIRTNQNKSHLPNLLMAFFILLLSLSSACTPVVPIPPTATTVDDAIAASEATISAQLTGIALPAASITPAGAMPEILASPTETLPATSTPVPTNTPFPTDTPEPPAPEVPNTVTPPETMAPTFSPDNPKAGLGEPTWVDEFSSGVVEWPLYNDEHVNMQLETGKLSMTALVANRQDPWDAWMVHPAPLTNFYAEAAATPGDCQGLDRYGLLARAVAETNQTYLFGFSCDGKYSLRYWDGQKISMLKEWTFHPSIHKGPSSENILGLMANGSQITLFANDTLLLQIEDETLSQGGIGLFVGAVMTDNFQVDFRRVAYWELP